MSGGEMSGGEMNEFEDILSDALHNRSRQAGRSPGSIVDVRRRARRHTRRRGVVGAGAVAALGTVGAVAVVAGRNGDDDRRTLAAGPGDAAGAAPGDGELWRCTGPTVGPIDPQTGTVDTVLPSTVASIVPSTTEVVPDDTLAPTTTYTGDAATSTSIANPSETTVPDDVAGTTTVVPYDDTASSTIVSFDVPPTSTYPRVGVPSTADGDYYFAHCEQIGALAGTSAPADGETSDSVAPPNMQVEASAVPNTARAPVFDPNDG